MRARELPRLHVVTGDEVLARDGFVAGATALMSRLGPEVAVHVRGPGTGGARLLHLAASLVPVADRAGACLLVNDRVDVALAAGAHGVHLGQRSLTVAVARPLLPTGALVGVSTHDMAEVLQAAGADYIFVGPAFVTPSHPGASGRGVAAVSEARDDGMPVVAIGGIRPEQVTELRDAGAHGVAVMRGIWDAPHPLDAAMRYLQALRSTVGGA